MVEDCEDEACQIHRYCHVSNSFTVLAHREPDLYDVRWTSGLICYTPFTETDRDITVENDIPVTMI